MYIMTDVLPVLKAIHADPKSAWALSDWFEDHGDLDTAVCLRNAPQWYSGWALVERICFDSGNGPFRRNPAVRQAVIDDAMERSLVADNFLRWPNGIAHSLRYRVDRLRGTREEVWVRIPFDPDWPASSFRYQDGIILRPVCIPCSLKAEPMCGGTLDGTMTLYVGFSRKFPYVSEPHPLAISNLHLSPIPF